MSDTEDTPEQGEGGRPRGIPAGGFDLGGLAAGDNDTTLGEQAGERRYPAPERAPAPAAPPEPDDRLTLPRSALVAFRKSGGLRFSSRSCVVYRSGRVERESLAEGPARATYLSGRELARLRHLLLRARLARWERERPAPRPDGFSYEIVARYGSDTRRVALAEFHIPDAIDPLVRALTKLLP